MSDTGHPMVEQRKHPRRKVQLFVTAQIDDVSPMPMHSLDLSRTGVCLRRSEPLLASRIDAASEPATILNMDVELCFETYPVSVWGSIVRVSPDGQSLGVSITRTSDDALWQSIAAA